MRALLLPALLPLLAQPPATQPRRIRTLLVTGGAIGGHDWRITSPLLRKALEDTGRFEVRVTEEFRGAGPETLAGYDLVVLNYYDGRDPAFAWPERTRTALRDFVRSGRGLVVYHFTIAAFLDWPEFETLCGGNWRPNQGHHSPAHTFELDIRDRSHPITRGLRAKLTQPADELYANLKWQPPNTYHVLATAWDDHRLYQGKARQPIPGDGLDQPVLWTLNYGSGRVFVTVLGHDGPADKTPVFTATFTRGAEWAATGHVTLPVPPALAEGDQPVLPEPRAVTPGRVAADPPSDAVVLFDGSSLDGWTRPDGSATGCRIENREMVCRTGAGDAVSPAKFRSAQIHVEFLVPEMPEQTGQLKGNSGVYIQKVTEIQILDGFGNPTYATGTVGAIYGQHPPLVNASRRPGEWSSYDIVYHAPVCNERGQEVRPGTLTVFLNGLLVQDNAPLRFQRTMCEPGPILLQDHSGFPGAPDTTMRFRNIWYRPLD
ncbi:MAG: ThuA domain-containing protein [Bryobacteraceae bacterium]